MAGFDEALTAYKKSDFKTASKEFQKLAKQGNAKAQYILGLMYRQGQGVSKDNVQAYMWLSLAAESKEKEAIKFRDLLAPKMTAAQIEEAQRLVRAWLAQHAKEKK